SYDGFGTAVVPAQSTEHSAAGRGHVETVAQRCGQDRMWTDFEKRVFASVRHSLGRAVESHGLTQTPVPVLGIGRSISEGTSEQGGMEGYFPLARTHGRQVGEDTLTQLCHVRSVGGVVDRDESGVNTLLLVPLHKSAYRFEGSGHDCGGRTVDSCHVHAINEALTYLLLGERNRGHGTGPGQCA